MEQIKQIINQSSDKFEFCVQFITDFSLAHIAELGVYRGDFAKELLENCESIAEYTMIDPWRNLSDWNKPANTDNNVFEEYYLETLRKTDFAKDKRKVLRGKTTEVIDQIDNESLDFVYIDGDHTLKGITIDLISMWPKVKESGFVIGDDFSPTIWQHNKEFEPTLVFPFAVHFAEAVNAEIYGLPFGHFLIAKGQTGFHFTDMTGGNYSNLQLRTQLIVEQRQGFKDFVKKNVPFASRLLKGVRGYF